MSTASSWTFPPPPVEARPSEFTSIEWEVLRQVSNFIKNQGWA